MRGLPTCSRREPPIRGFAGFSARTESHRVRYGSANKSRKSLVANNSLILLVPQEGFEPQTPSLRIRSGPFFKSLIADTFPSLRCCPIGNYASSLTVP
jgi:hypothetical protein